MADASSTNSISDSFALVKEYDSEFKPKPVNEYLLNKDGTPKVLYHQTGEVFTIFDTRRKGAGTRDQETPFGIFLKPTDADIGLKGKMQMALYAQMHNPMVIFSSISLLILPASYLQIIHTLYIIVDANAIATKTVVSIRF